jgi:hypothetical protein
MVVLVAPLLWFEFLPTEDGPSHLALASVFASLLSSGSDVIDRFYILNAIPVPNLLGTVVLGVLQLFVGTAAAEKILLGSFVVGLGVSVRYTLGSIRPDARFLSLLAVPLGLGLVAHLGFYNFFAGLILFVVTVGYWNRHLGDGEKAVQGRTVAGLGVLLLLTYLGHILPFLSALFVIATVSLASAIGATEAIADGRLAAAISEFWRRTRWVLVAALPSLGLSVVYLVNSNDAVGGGVRGLAGRVVWLATLGELFVAFSLREMAFAMLIAVAVAALALVAIRRRWNKGRSIIASDGYLSAAIVFGVVYLFVPSRIGGGSAVPDRLAMFTFLVALLWLAHFRYPQWLKASVVVVAIIATVGLVGTRWSAYQAFNRDLQEYASATEIVDKESTLLPLSLISGDSGAGGTAAAYRVRPLVEAGSLYGASGETVNLNHLHGEYDYSPAYFAPELNGRLLLGVPPGTPDPIYAVPPSIDIPSFETQTDETVDYVLLWGRIAATAETLNNSDTVNLMTTLTADYELIFTSEGRGLLEVYSRR